MRKKTIKCLVDEIFWGLIYMLPLFAMLLVTYRTGTLVGVSEAMSSIGFNVVTDNFIVNSLASVFGASGVVPMFSNDILVFMGYFICAWILHIMVDVLLWLPRWFHKLMSGGEK